MEQLRKSIEARLSERERRLAKADDRYKTALRSDDAEQIERKFYQRCVMETAVDELNWVLSEISRIEALESEKAVNTTPEPVNTRDGAEKEE